MYLKNDMRSKMNLLNNLEAAVRFMLVMMAQHTYSGTHTIVLEVCLLDYLKVRHRRGSPSFICGHVRIATN